MRAGANRAQFTTAPIGDPMCDCFHVPLASDARTRNDRALHSRLSIHYDEEDAKLE
jgi:hypothetical protein